MVEKSSITVEREEKEKKIAVYEHYLRTKFSNFAMYGGVLIQIVGSMYVLNKVTISIYSIIILLFVNVALMCRWLSKRWTINKVNTLKAELEEIKKKEQDTVQQNLFNNEAELERQKRWQALKEQAEKENN